MGHRALNTEGLNDNFRKASSNTSRYDGRYSSSCLTSTCITSTNTNSYAQKTIAFHNPKPNIDF